MRKLLLAVLVLLIPAMCQAEKMPAGAKVCMTGDPQFTAALRGGFSKKQVPLVVVADCKDAQYEIRGGTSHKGSAARGIFTGVWNTQEASIDVVNLKSGEVIFGYNWQKGNRNLQSAAEGCAKHIKNDAVER